MNQYQISKQEELDIQEYFASQKQELIDNVLYYSNKWNIKVNPQAIRTMHDNYGSWSALNNMTRREAYQFCLKQQVLETMTPMKPLP